MLCFYHSTDFDGKCSAAIIKSYALDTKLVGINYGDPFPWDEITDYETVYMVDYALPDMDDMKKLNSMVKLYWIDHHVSAIKAAEKCGIKFNGKQEIGIGACKLVWEFIYHNTPIPEGIRLLADYDVWVHSNPKTLPFQYGLRCHKDTSPGNLELWTKLFTNKDRFIDETVEIGKSVLGYVEASHSEYISVYGFETELDGHKAIATNIGLTGSKVFDSIWDPKKYDMMITFVFDPKGFFRCGIYTSKDIDLSVIAKKYGGGGHASAAGFECENLPFGIS